MLTNPVLPSFLFAGCNVQVNHWIEARDDTRRYKVNVTLTPDHLPRFNTLFPGQGQTLNPIASYVDAFAPTPDILVKLPRFSDLGMATVEVKSVFFVCSQHQ